MLHHQVKQSTFLSWRLLLFAIWMVGRKVPFQWNNQVVNLGGALLFPFCFAERSTERASGGRHGRCFPSQPEADECWSFGGDVDEHGLPDHRNDWCWVRRLGWRRQLWESGPLPDQLKLNGLSFLIFFVLFCLKGNLVCSVWTWERLHCFTLCTEWDMPARAEVTGFDCCYNFFLSLFY